MALHIDGPQSGKLSEAIENAYPDFMSLQRVLETKLDDSIFNYAGFAAQYPEIRHTLILQYNARWHIDKLVLALLEDRPDNALLVEFAWRHQILKRPPNAQGQRGPDDGSLERMLDPVRGYTDVGPFLFRLGQVVNCTCQISYPVNGATAYGTGFLIGDETVLTNWHVVEKVSAANRKDVQFLFDYHTGPDGTSLTKGVVHRLVDDDAGWLLDHSPYHSDDTKSLPLDQVVASTRPEDHLDFAVLRVAGEPGKKRIGVKTMAGKTVRGHLALNEASNKADDFEAGKAALFLFQHPYEDGQSLPLQLDFSRPAILGVNANQTRVLYNVNSRRGSSGSACLNAKLELMALHHAGGKDWPNQPNLLYNQGIPIQKIIQRLKRPGGPWEEIR